ncbi:hypothetical protein MTER_39520 [Mycolicibacter terrae]|uniref:Uncharacterized protein n=1 Tax=Mycolicibacter terrae TaxID=1788 RepID=A0AAD1I6I9_9MYCO|nr:hypothetical protein MTER_39520 [Mycolicibacter terrae]
MQRIVDEELVGGLHIPGPGDRDAAAADHQPDRRIGGTGGIADREEHGPSLNVGWCYRADRDDAGTEEGAANHLVGAVFKFHEKPPR